MPHHNTLPPTTIETAPATERLDDTFKALSEKLVPRIEHAVESLDVEATPEVQEAVESYYEDHYKASEVVRRLIDNETVDGAALADEADGLESFALAEALAGAAYATDRTTQLNTLGEIIGKRLFAESSIGQTSIDEPELHEVLHLQAQLRETAIRENVLLDRHKVLSDEEVVEERAKAVKTFWEDSRAAGQLQFHNTPFPDVLARDGFKLRTKPNQLRVTGDYNSVTADVKGHSSTIHFSEIYHSDGYKTVQSGKESEEVTIGATIAIPLAKIIEQAPYARGGEYGVVTAKPGRNIRATINDSAEILRENGGGSDIRQGAHGLDRTFYADKYDRGRGENYALDFGATTRSATGNTAHILFLQRDIDRAHRKQFMKDGRNVDARLNYGSGEAFPITEVIGYDHVQALGQYGGAAELQAGARFVRESLDRYDAHLQEHPLAEPDARLARALTDDLTYSGETQAQQSEALKNRIRELQRASREHPDFRDKLVVMLRAGTMAYKPTA